MRELANCLRRAVALAATSEIGSEVAALRRLCLDIRRRREASSSDNRLRAGVSLGDMERKLVALTLEATGGNRSRAAALLGVSLRTVRNKIRSYGLPQLEQLCP